MAGDTKETSASETSEPMVDDPFPTIAEKLSGILDALLGIGWQVFGPFEIAAADTSSTIESQWPKMRVQSVIITADNNARVLLRVGTQRYPFEVNTASPVFPFPIVIERGTDVAFEVAVAGAVVAAYLIGMPE